MGTKANQRNAIGKERQKWMQLWVSIEEQFAVLPAWAQDTLFNDISNIVQNRIIVVTSTRKAVAA